MDNAKQHWTILQKLGNDLENRVRSFLVIGKNGDGVIVATEDGEVFWLGKMGFGWGENKTAAKPTPLDVPGLVQMTQSRGHILLLNKRGQIYSMGRNCHGQLGLGNGKREIYLLPQLIPSPHKYASVRCGPEHSLALTEDGKVWAWGRNKYGQVGVPSSTSSLSSPHQIPELDPYRVVAVECGGNHSLVLTDQGEVYAWGMNDWGQLGYKSLPTTIETSSCLSKVEGLPSITQIATHPHTNLSIAMSSDQRCFIWGVLPDETIITTPWELPPIYTTVESPLSFFSRNRSTLHSVTIRETPPSRLSNRMSRMFDNPETSDIQFVVEQKTFHAHRIILSNSSDYFARMFSERLLQMDPENPIVRVTIPDHSYQVFHVFLRFLYTDSFDLHPNLLPELFDLASQYLESDLQQLCLSRMRTTLTTATCCLYYQLTLRHSMPELEVFQQELVQFISTNFLEVINSVAYQSMGAELCKKLTISMANHFS